ncbi:MAG TPA: hypothetical protein GXX75_27215 [Clostridiales bacterium]|nr:hypothetical protein [Clostridiales bacterium]
MIYDDGFAMDVNLRVTQCPKCGNEQFSNEAEFCRICGVSLYNLCEGEDIYDYNGKFDHHEEHKNSGNARFCEKCGRPTYFFKEAFLLPYDDVREEYVERYLKANPTAISGNTVMVLTGVSDDNDDLPF